MTASARPRVLLTRRVPEVVVDELARRFELELHDAETPLPRDELFTRAAGKDGVVAMLTDRIDDELLEAAGPQLRVVANYAVGFDNVDVEACTRHGVVVTNTPDVLTAATAELTLAIMLDVVRRISEGDRGIRAGTTWIWSPTYMLGATLENRLLGVVGLGRIGREVARLAEAFGMRVAYTKPSGPVEDVDYEHTTFDDLVARADVLSLHCPLTPETRHLVDREVLRAMKPTAYLVNTTRGPVVDELALAEALETREIAGAALDVFEREPLVEERLLACENVVLAPHLGSAALETREAMGMLCVAGASAVLLEDRLPENALNPEAWAS